jgi:hypothetical protein
MGTDWLENVMNSWFPHSWAMASDTDEQTYQIMVQQWKSTEDWAVAFWKRHTVKRSHLNLRNDISPTSARSSLSSTTKASLSDVLSS